MTKCPTCDGTGQVPDPGSKVPATLELPKMLPSVACSTFGIQACHNCDDLECYDNLNRGWPVWWKKGEGPDGGKAP